MTFLTFRIRHKTPFIHQKLAQKQADLKLFIAPIGRHSPKRELANPYHRQPRSPMSHLPCRLAAKLKGVPKTHTRMSDVHQDEVDGRPEGAKLCEDEKNNHVAEDPRH